jgi:hypothetical protein
MLTFAPLVLLTMTFVVAPIASATRGSNPYSIGSSIRALKLTRLQMLTSKIGVGVAPITTFSGRLVRAYLVRTNDGGETWRVTGVFPNGFYPWTTGFTTPDAGYVINGSGVLFTSNAGQTWAYVKATGGPLSISVKGRVIWIPVEDCVTNAMQGPCSTHLDSYGAGDLTPSSVTSLRTDQPVLAHVGPTSGYAFGSSGVSGDVFITSNSGVTWRSVTSPCQGHPVTEGSVASLTRLSIICEVGSGGSEAPVLFGSLNEGRTWTRVNDVPAIVPGDEVASAGSFMWVFAPTLHESSDGGRNWTVVANVKYGPSGDITTFGASEAWHPVPGHGIYRTLNGRTWKLLR